MATQHDAETKVWQDKEMPVWRFDTYAEMEASVDHLFPEDSFVLEFFPNWDGEDPMWAVAFSDSPQTVDTAMVIIHVDEALVPECPCPDHEDTA